MQLRLGYVWGENSRYLGPSEYSYALAAGVESLRSNGVEMDVHIKTHPRFMDEWVDLLVRTLLNSRISRSILLLSSLLVVRCCIPIDQLSFGLVNITN